MNIEFTQEELMTVGAALGRLPYDQVAPLLSNIQKQINEQQEPPAKAEESCAAG